MNIHPKVSLLILNLCGCDFIPRCVEHQWLDYVIRNRWTYNIEENILFLKSKNTHI